MSRIIKSDKFAVQAADGRQFEVIEYTKYIAAGTPSNPHAEIPGLTEYRTSDGFHLDVVADDTFEIAELSLLVKRIRTGLEMMLGNKDNKIRLRDRDNIILGSRDKLRDRPHYCVLCGTRNPGASKQCMNCGIPLSYYNTGEMPEGWEKCMILWEDLYDADATHRFWRLVGRVQTHHDTFSIHPSAPFILLKGWEQSDFVPDLPPDGEVSLQTLRRELLAEGWIPSTSPSQFWRKTAPAVGISDTPAQTDKKS